MMKRFMNKTLHIIVALGMSLLMVMSLLIPNAAPVKAEETPTTISTFNVQMVSGAKKDDQDRYVWTPKQSYDKQRFTFRINYALSGTHDLAPEGFKITIPKSILKNREGHEADSYELSIPTVEEAMQAEEEEPNEPVDYAYKESDDHNSIIIFNRHDISATTHGYIEVSYFNAESTLNYKDMEPSNPFKAQLFIKNADKEITEDSNEIPLYIDTDAKIFSVKKEKPQKIYREWDSNWGVQPENAKGKWFLIWDIETRLSIDTQPYTITFEDTPKTDGLMFLGYRVNGSGTYSKDNTTATSLYGNSVLTAYDPSKYANEDFYTLENSIKATIMPIDTPNQTTANSSSQFRWDTPKFVYPIGQFYGRKYGNNNWHEKFGYYWDYASYNLDKFQDGSFKSIDKFKYYIDIYGYAYPFTAVGSLDNPNNYGKKKVKYELTDDTLYLDENIVNKPVGTVDNYIIPEDARKLTKDDYRYLSATWNAEFDIRKYDDETKSFVTDPNARNTEPIDFWVRIDDEWKKVATYNGISASNLDTTIVKTFDRNKIEFTDNSNVTGFRITTSNAYYYTKISAYPMISLKNSEYVMNKVKNKKVILLQNFDDINVYDQDGKNLISVRKYAFDRAVKPLKGSSLEKQILSTGNNRARKKYELRWKISQRETIKTDDKQSDIVQESGKFYDLLPKGTHLKKKSIQVETEKGYLDKNAFTYEVIQNYLQSGRDLVVVDIPVQAKYYNLYLNIMMNWDAIKDYGGYVQNPVAYETGNDEISGGKPNTGDGLSPANKPYLSNLDNGIAASRFLYDESGVSVEFITSAVTGLKKQVKSVKDTDYSYKTYVSSNQGYSYQLRLANTYLNKRKQLVLFDSLENYVDGDKKSSWHGALQSVDLSQLKSKDIQPILYMSKQDKLSIEEHHDLTDSTIWQKVTDTTDLSQAKAIAIDCSKKKDGSEYILNEGDAINAILYMQAPEKVPNTSTGYQSAYNNVYISDKLVIDGKENTNFIHQDYTQVNFIITGNVKLHKQSSKTNDAVEGAKYRLTGTSAYGTKIDLTETTSKNGNLTFEDIEKGTYTLKETYSPRDYLLDKTEYTVVINDEGKFTVSKKQETPTNNYVTLTDDPRIHGNLVFIKKDLVDKTKRVANARFSLSGKSAYNNDIILYATSDENGTVRFEDIEYGVYTMKEVQPPSGYIPNDIEYTVVVDDQGNAGIQNAKLDTTGSIIIYNEPYHTIQISKQSSYNDEPLSGSQFSLKGTSDKGTKVDMLSTSGKDGLVHFNNLESGTYILQETIAPDGYNIDVTKHAVKIEKDGTYTIDGSSKNDSGYYRINNDKKKDKTIIVKKVWKDNKTNDQRPTPVIHISTDINKIPSYVEWREDKLKNDSYSNEYSPFSHVDMETYPFDPRYMINEITYSDIPENEIPDDAVRLDKNYNNPNSKFKIYGWKKDNTIYYWTNAQSIRMNNNVKKMYSSYWYVSTIDLNKIDTSYMTDMSNMFSECGSLSTLDLSTFNTANVTDMSGMFSRCGSLSTLNLSTFNTENVTNMSDMFSNCGSLSTFDLLTFNTANVKDMSGMFSGCGSLSTLDLSTFNTANVTDMSFMFYDCGSLSTLDLSTFNAANVKDMRRMFSHCYALSSIDLSTFNAANVIDMSFMFYDCFSLSTLDLSTFNAANVTDMNYMFYNCSSLSTLDLSTFNTANVTDMSNMFSNCSSLSTLDLSTFNTANVTDMIGMFDGCSSLSTLDLSTFNTANVTDMNFMFNGCSSLSTLDLSTFNTANVESMRGMFYKCGSLSTLDLSTFNTANVTDMSFMFYNCTALSSLDLSTFNAANVTDMSGMFSKCGSLSTLDLSSFNTANVKYMKELFGDDTRLLQIYVSDKWTVSHLSDKGYDMFRGCSSLPNFDSTKKDATKAYYAGDGKGYLTYKAAPAKSNGIFDALRSITSSITSFLKSFSIISEVHAEDKAMYSSNADDVKITQDGDVWTYEFSVSDDKAKYYAWEDDLEGYVSSNDITNPIETTKEQPAQIVNTLKNISTNNFYSLDLTKKVDGKQGEVIDVPLTKYSHTPNIDDQGNQSGNYSNNMDISDVVTIVGASKLHVKIIYGGYYNDWACMWQGSHPDYTAFNNYNSSVTGELSGGDHTNVYNTKEYDVSGDTVTFGFISDGVDDGDGDGYGYYAVVTGFDENGKEIPSTKKGYKVTEDSPTVEVPAKYKDMSYLFTITLTGNNIKGTQIFGDVIFNDGIGMVSLKDGETVHLTDIPEGTFYKVKENEYGNFVTTSTNINGLLNEKNNHASVNFSNTYVEVVDEDVEANGFTLRKQVEGAGSSSRTYGFDVSFKNLGKNMEYSLGNNTFTSDNDGNGYVHVTLKKDEELKIGNLPVGSQYKITEVAGEYKPSYMITGGNTAQSADMVDATNTSLSTAWESVDKDENIVVTFINKLEIYQNLTIKKTTSGIKSDDQFKFNIHFSNIINSGFISDELGMITPEDDGTADASFELGSDEEVTFKDVPVSTQYQITEIKNRGKASYTVVAGSDQKTKANPKSYTDLTTDIESIIDGHDTVVTFNNEIPAQILLKKEVTGSFGDYSKPFKFTVTFDNVSLDEEITVDSKDATDNNPQIIKKNSEGKVSGEVILKHNESVIFKDVPVGAKYSIVEESSDYDVSYKIDNGNVVKEASLNQREVANNDTITFINHKDGVVPTGTHFGILTMLLAFVGFLGFVFYMLLKTNDEQ
ncbi:MAG: BspA family leucine-rich repeat surface protein [Sharpea porci]|uniref:BspA family leucine-rich repeat surface protein n=1 Tax=Sharpea porci TaxID=2652286 RepID=UPI002409C5F9|nr:BspA family leucine-rich repeat surface protein [Sharpea porci]MDD6711888.1 BspA family leucine-rich repeat surface protein [Sharpea porci]